MEKDPRTFAIVDAAMEVHRSLGPGFLEAVYHETLARELAKQAVPFCSEVELPVFCKGEGLLTSYRCDFVCDDTVTVEVKALAHVTGLEEAQVINYLKVSGYAVGLLLNFGSGSLEHRRFVLSPVKSAQSAKSVDQ